jgi:hypothetical protein
MRRLISQDQSNLLAIFEVLSHEKALFSPSKWPRKFRTRKMLSKFPTNCFDPVGIGDWPLIPTWINPPLLERNGLHCIEFPVERGKHFLNLNLGELPALLKKLHYLTY